MTRKNNFLIFLNEKYIEKGENKFTMDNFPTFLKYGTAKDAMRILNMNEASIRSQYLKF